MSKNKIEKFENTDRLSELRPAETLKRIGLNKESVMCDLGAGSGIFCFPAAEVSQKSIYALEISDTMIQLLEERKKEKGKNNLIIKKVNSPMLPLDTQSCDIVIMVTVLHEVEDRIAILQEIKRILKPNGRVMIIDFQKKKTPFGPPVEYRISMDKAEQLCNQEGLKTADKFLMGDNFYTLVLERA